MSVRLVKIGISTVALLGAVSAVLVAQSSTSPGKLAFIATSCTSTGGGPCLALMNADGTNLVELTTTDASEPVWSPDGSRIAYTNATGLFVIAAEGGIPTNLVASTYASSPSWSPDGTRIVLSNAGVQVVPSSGGALVSLTAFDSSNGNPAWSPKAERIAFLSNRDHLPDWATFELYAMNANGSGVSRLAAGIRATGKPAWSSDGSHIVFSCASASQAGVCVVGADGMGFTVVANDGGVDNSPADATMPSWSSQMKIAYGAAAGSDPYCGYRLSTVNVVGADGSGLMQLGAGTGTTGTTVRSPVWSPAADRIAFTNWDIDSWEYIPYCAGPACDAGIYYYCSATPSVYVMNGDGTNKLSLAAGYDDAWQPASAGAAPLVAAFTYLCSDLACTFDASGSQGAASYAWKFADGATGSGQIATHTYATGDSTFNVILTATGANGDLAVMSQPVVPTPPVVAFTFICSGLTCTFDASSSKGSIATYQWTFGDGTSGSGAVTSHTYPAGREYPVTLTVITAGGVKALGSQFVIANNLPVASFTATCRSLTCTFDGSGSQDLDGTIASYAWAFGDKGTASGSTSTHTYRSPGTYKIALIVTDNRGATGAQDVTIALKRQPAR